MFGGIYISWECTLEAIDCYPTFSNIQFAQLIEADLPHGASLVWFVSVSSLTTRTHTFTSGKINQAIDSKDQ